MTIGEVRLVALPCDDEVSTLIADIESAAARAAKADPADRSDIVRYEALCVRLERQAVTAWQGGAASAPVASVKPSDLPAVLRPGQEAPATAVPEAVRRKVDAWREEGFAVVCVCLPLALGGEREEEREAVSAPPPAERWESEDGASGRRAVEERFRDQLESALATTDPEARRTISPSGIQNTVVTEILRKYVAADGGAARVDAVVEYRDGSKAQNTFPLRALAFTDEAPADPDLSLRMALLSIRHTEMDAVVDGAWLRNAEISRPRPAAQTDDLVYEISRAQIAELTKNGTRSLQLHMFQTGLETAVVGFYRAVTLHLMEHPGSLCVVPMFHQAPSRPKSKQRRGKKSVTQSRSPFRRGEVWAA